MRSISSVIVFGLSLYSAGTGLAQPPGQFNVRTFGAAGDGIRPDTDAINKTIQAARDAGGGTVLVPAGAYVSGTIQLQNNVTLWIDAGATILGRITVGAGSAIAGNVWLTHGVPAGSVITHAKERDDAAGASGI